MAQRNGYQKLVLAELQEIKSEMKEVRQKDIPSIHAKMAGFTAELNSVREKTSIRTTIITGVGGFVAVVLSLTIAFLR